MKFEIITEAEYKEFWRHYPNRAFLSAPEIGHLNSGQKALFYGVRKNNAIIAAAMIRGTKRRFGLYDYYSPRGILVDYKDKRLVSFFVERIRAALKSENGFIFRMDPNVELVERDIDGNIVAGGVDNTDIVKNLYALGFHRSEYIDGVSQVTWEFVLPLGDKSEEGLMSKMKPNTRRRLKQALELGIYTKTLAREDLQSFYSILQGTAERKGFTVREYEYFQKMYDLFSPIDGIKYVSAVINPAKSTLNLENKLKETRDLAATTIREKKDQDDAVKSIECRIEKMRSLFPEPKDEEIVLSSGMFMTGQPEILHLFGGNDERYMKLDGQYVLQWEMILEALRGGYEQYNFYGIPPEINKHPDGYGIYEFKRGFSGRVVELIGEYEMPLSPYYYLEKIISRLHLMGK